MKKRKREREREISTRIRDTYIIFRNYIALDLHLLYDKYNTFA